MVYSSIYANVTEEGLYELINLEKLKLEDLKEMIDLPEIDFKRFEQNFFIPDGNKSIDEEGMKNTENECPKCGFKW